jgi:hypothetical protein
MLLACAPAIGSCEDNSARYEIESRLQILEAENARLRGEADLAASENARLRGEADLAASENDRYDDCIANAQANYNSRWDDSCRRLRAIAENDRVDCEAANGRGNPFCDRIEIPPQSDCSLPNRLANDYDEGYRHAQSLCLGRLRANR